MFRHKCPICGRRFWWPVNMRRCVDLHVQLGYLAASLTR